MAYEICYDELPENEPWLSTSSQEKNVLVVDDNPTNRKLLRGSLQAEHYSFASRYS